MADRLLEALDRETALRKRMDRRWNTCQEFLEQERETSRLLARALDEQNAKLAAARDLLQAWEPRVICPQCGQRYSCRACGPTHAVVSAIAGVVPSKDSDRE